MPIQKNTVLRNGVSGNYWVVQNFYVSPAFDNAQVTMNFFTSQAAYLSGQAALDQRVYDLSGPNCPVSIGALRPLIEVGLIDHESDFVSGTQVL